MDNEEEDDELRNMLELPILLRANRPNKHNVARGRSFTATIKADDWKILNINESRLG